MKKAVLKVELHDEKAKKKAMKTVSGLSVAGTFLRPIDSKARKAFTLTRDWRVVSEKEGMEFLCNRLDSTVKSLRP